MKIWGIIATVLLIAFIGTSGWFYIQNRDLKSQKSKLETDLSAAKADGAQKLTAATDKMTAASKKIDVLTMIFSGINDQNASLEAYVLIKAMNNETLTADWNAMQNSKPGDDTGGNLMKDLLAAASKDLKQ